MPFAAGSTQLSVAFGGPTFSTTVDVSVLDTYQPGWPVVDTFVDALQAVGRGGSCCHERLQLLSVALCYAGPHCAVHPHQELGTRLMGCHG